MGNFFGNACFDPYKMPKTLVKILRGKFFQKCSELGGLSWEFFRVTHLKVIVVRGLLLMTSDDFQLILTPHPVSSDDLA